MNESIILRDKARFTVITENLIRLEYAENRVFCDDETLFAVCRAHNGCAFSIEETENTLHIQTSAISLTYQKDGKPFSAENLYGVILGEEWHFGKQNAQNLGGTLSTLDGVDGYRKVDEGLIARDGWFVIDDSDATPIHGGWLARGTARRETDIYLFGYGNDYKKALQTLFYVSGKPALPRKYVFGSWYSRWWAYTDEEILAIVDEYDQNDFPLDIMVIDMDWHHHDWTYRGTEECKKHRATAGYGHASNLGWTGYTWNHRLIKDPPELLRKLHDNGIFVTLNDHPHDGIRTHEEAYPDFMQKLGLPPESGFDVEFDAGNERYMNAFFESVHTKEEKNGVDFWWLDWQQDHLKPVVKGTKMKHIPWLNFCYYHHAEKNGKRGLSFSRWGGFGDHKHPIYFSGDTKATWDCLRFEVEFTATSSNVGLFYWGHDTGGFFGEPNAEMYVRWTQFSAFSACLRAHSERNATLDRRPWKWGEKEADAMRKSYHLRSRLMPYIYSLAYRTYEEGIPFIEPMYYEYPEDADAYTHGGQYFFGNAFLCSPITSPMNENGEAAQTVWLKDGTWYDFFTSEKYESGTHEIACPLDRFPLFVKGGVPIPTQPYTKRMTTTPIETLIITVFPAEKGEFTLYEDDGISRDFENGAFLKTHLTYQNQNGEITVTITPEGKGYQGMSAKRDYIIELPSSEKALSLTEGDGTVLFENGKNTVTLPKCDIRTALKIKLK
ncbi:MAG: DUF5110 domain-containing protein [Clostridia bacterium]|nr:DUF5110 domain-containing protein [Clostridia bacterium]